MSDRTDDADTADRRLIREAKEEAWHQRRKLRREMPHPSGETKRQVACALADYRDLLCDYRDERALQTPWDERTPNPDDVDRLLRETTTIEEPVAYRKSATRTREVPLAHEVDADWLLDVADELDAIAKELGFAASASDPTPNDEADMGDLRGLLETRGQTEALDRLPGGSDDADANEANGD
jgi:hypothetical protein